MARMFAELQDFMSIEFLVCPVTQARLPKIEYIKIEGIHFDTSLIERSCVTSPSRLPGYISARFLYRRRFSRTAACRRSPKDRRVELAYAYEQQLDRRTQTGLLDSSYEVNRKLDSSKCFCVPGRWCRLGCYGCVAAGQWLVSTLVVL